MNKQDIIKRLTNTQLDIHERESLSQLLDYLHAEGLNNTSSNNNTSTHKRSTEGKKSFTHSSNYKGKNPEGRIKDSSHKHTSSNKHTR
jgi:hypothetical protein